MVSCRPVCETPIQETKGKIKAVDEAVFHSSVCKMLQALWGRILPVAFEGTHLSSKLAASPRDLAQGL